MAAPELYEDLGNGLAMHSLRGEEDAGAFIALNQAVTGEGAICDRLIHRRPGSSAADFFVVEDTRSGEVLSTTCLLAWQLDYCGIPLKTAMLEMVVTRPAHRGGGLVRAQIQRYHRLVDQLEMDLCIIQGIPFYYRQYGYAYALDHRPTVLLPAEAIPAAWRPAMLEPAGTEDRPRLQALYDGVAARWQIHVARPADYWQYLHRDAGLPYHMVRAAESREPTGYALWRADGTLMRVDEQAFADAPAAEGFLAWTRGQPVRTIEIHGHPADPLVRLAQSLGATEQERRQWLLRIPDPARFLRRIAPALEARLSEAGYAHLETSLVVNLFRRAFRLRFAAGRLTSVEEEGFVNSSMDARDAGDLLIPPDAFVRLALGYRGLDELGDAWPELWVRPSARHVVETLFPPLGSFVHMPY